MATQQERRDRQSQCAADVLEAAEELNARIRVAQEAGVRVDVSVLEGRRTAVQYPLQRVSVHCYVQLVGRHPNTDNPT